MPLELRGALDQLGFADIGFEPACATRPLTAASPPTTAAADEPSPRECGMALRQRTFRPATRDADGTQAVLDRAHDEMRRVQWYLTRALTLDLDDQAGFRCLDDDFVVEAQRETEAVEARARDWRWTPRRRWSPSARQAGLGHRRSSVRPVRALRRRRPGRRGPA